MQIEVIQPPVVFAFIDDRSDIGATGLLALSALDIDMAIDHPKARILRGRFLRPDIRKKRKRDLRI